jgi:TPR repeat protein
MYQKGQGVDQDHAQALYWYRCAAEQGYAPAQYNLGWLYAKGQGVAPTWAGPALVQPGGRTRATPAPSTTSA